MRVNNLGPFPKYKAKDQCNMKVIGPSAKMTKTFECFVYISTSIHINFSFSLNLNLHSQVIVNTNHVLYFQLKLYPSAKILKWMLPFLWICADQGMCNEVWSWNDMLLGVACQSRIAPNMYLSLHMFQAQFLRKSSWKSFA